MTKDEFMNWDLDDGTIRIGEIDANFVLVKRPDQNDGGIAIREDYEEFRESYAHAFVDRGVFRHKSKIGDISDLTPISKGQMNG